MLLYLANFAGEGEGATYTVTRVRRNRGKVGGMHPHPQQAGPKIPSSLNVRKKVVISSLLYSLVCGLN
jgi:hypothetical protein